MNLLGHLLAFVFVNDHKRFMGVRRSLLVRGAPLLAGLVGLAATSRLALLLVGVALTLLLHLLWTAVHRAGYTRFRPDNAPPPAAQVYLPAEQQINVRATGVFSIFDREDRMFLRTAQLWRVALGDHVIMVAIAPKRYRYEFVNQGDVEHIESGHLIFGPQPLPTLAVTFGSTWGPRYAQVQRAYYVHPDESPPPVRKTIYLTFADEETRQRVWQSLAGA